MARVYTSAAWEAAEANPLKPAEVTQKDVAVEVSMYALKETLSLAGQIVDLLV